MLPVALQLYSVRDSLAEDFFGTLKKVRELGYDGVEFACGLFGNAPEEIRDFLLNIGLVPVSAHVGLPEMRERGDAVLRITRRSAADILQSPVHLMMKFRGLSISM